MVDWIIGRNALTFAKDQQSLARISYIQQQLFSLKRVQEQEVKHLEESHFFELGDKKVLLVQDRPLGKEWELLPCIDVLILNRKMGIEELRKIKMLDYTRLVLGPRLSSEEAQMIRKEEASHTMIIDMRKEGDVLLDLNKI